MSQFWELPDGSLSPESPLFVREGHASEWQCWFAWYPVKTYRRGESFGTWTWLRIIERRIFFPAAWFVVNRAVVEHRRIQRS